MSEQRKKSIFASLFPFSPSTPDRSPHSSSPIPTVGSSTREGSFSSRSRFQSVDTATAQHKSDLKRFFSRFPRRKSKIVEIYSKEDTQYETISPLLEVPSLSEFETEKANEAANTRLRFHQFFNRSPSPILEDQELSSSCSTTDQPQMYGWKAPDSWAVRIPEPNFSSPEFFTDVDFDSPTIRTNRRHDSVSSMSGFIFYPPLDEDYFPTITDTLWSIRIFKPSPRKKIYSTTNRRGSTSGMTFATISCPFMITTGEICSILAKKFFIPDPEHYRLYVYYRGLERVLDDADRPIMMQCKWLQELGYTEQDGLPKLGREEHGYHFWFSYNEFPSVNAPPSDFLEQQTTNLTNDVRLEATSAHLVGLTLYMLPVALFKYTSTIETIDFSNNPMLSLPQDFFEQCVNLRTFRLSHCSVENIPPAILYASSLTHLDLSNNNLKAPALYCLGALTKLTHLYLDNNYINDLPNSFSTLISIQVLSISNNQLTNIPSVLTTMANLRELDFSFNEIKHLSNLHIFSDLRILMLRGNMISGYCEIGENPVLEYCDLRENEIQDLTVHPKCHSSLKTLLIDKNQISMLPSLKINALSSLSFTFNSLKFMKCIYPLSDLVMLNLSHCEISLLPLDMFLYTPNIEHLYLDHNRLTKWSVSLFNCSKLRTLSFSFNELEELPSEIEMLTNLEYLNLFCNSIQKISKSIWKSSLVELNLSSNRISLFPSPVGLAEDLLNLPLSKLLQRLHLCDNQLSDDVLDVVGYFRNLNVLNLAYNEIVNVNTELSDLPHLQHLYLSGNHLTSMPEDLVSLVTLFTDDNKLSNIPAEIANNCNLTIFDASNNNLKYNINNWPYDWNWNYNPALRYLNLSGNRRLDLKAPQGDDDAPLSSFRDMGSLRILDISYTNYDKGILPEETSSTRIRHSLHDPTSLISATVDAPEFSTGNLGEWDLVVPSFLGTSKECLYGIFSSNDGDPEIPKYLAGAFPFIFGTELRKVKQEETLVALKRSFLNLNRDLSLTFLNTEKGASSAIVYVKDSKVYLGNVGNVGIVLGRGSKALVLSKLHVPIDDKEFKRIRNVGGFLSAREGKLDGELHVARSYGHFDKTPLVTAEPYIDEIELEDEDSILIIASAEFFECIPHQQAIDIALAEKSNVSTTALKLRAIAMGTGRFKPFSLMVVNVSGLSATASDVDSKVERSKRRGLRDSLVSDTIPTHEIPAPIGEITMVFTHIVNGFSLWEAFPNSMPEAVRLHNSVIREYLNPTCGYEVKTDSDVFMIAFPTVFQALQWCCLVQKQLLEVQWPEEILSYPDCEAIALAEGQVIYRGLSVKMGIHCGIPICELDPITRRMDYFGSVVNRSARVRSAALGGEICLSNEAYTAWMQNPTFDVDIHCYGRVKLKGVDNPELIYIAYPPELSARQHYRGIYEQASKVEELAARLARIGTEPEMHTVKHRPLDKLESAISELEVIIDKIESKIDEGLFNEKLSEQEAEPLFSLTEHSDMESIGDPKD